METQTTMVWLTGIIALATLGNVGIACWYAKSTRKILYASFIKDLCDLYHVGEVRRKTAMFKVLLPKEFEKVEQILRSSSVEK